MNEKSLTEMAFRIRKAKQFAMDAHKDQRRDDGSPYWNHISKVGELVSAVTDDADIICAAYLHDTLEDTSTTYDDLVREFGYIVAGLVAEVTHEGQKDAKGYYFPRLKTRHAIMIKFADRLANISDMDSWSEERQEHYLRKSQFWRSTGNQHYVTGIKTEEYK